MPEARPTEIRLYCLCGQKMKITSNMFGKPGKCVACRQKIRIPARDELPADAATLYLKDHPEFLRALKKDVIALPDSASAPEAEADGDDLLLAGEPDELAPIPFVLYEPLGRLCNYEFKVDAQLALLREGKPAELDKATLMGYRGLARNARQLIEKRFRDELAIVATELREIREALARESAALRSGVLAYVEFSKRVLPYRKRREALTYRQQNLRGWLATEDPHMAGGLIDLPLSDVPVDPTEAPFPLARDVDNLPLEHAVLKLEEALRQREKADRRLNELHHANLNGAINAEQMKPLRADTDAERERARTGVAFYRSRLQHAIQDCEEDSSAIQAHLDTKRSELERGAITKATYQVLEESFFRAQLDIKRARNMATRALNANTVSDVPNPRGTFLERLARPGIQQRGLGIDSWLGWLASALMMAVIFVPLGDNVPGGNPATFPGLTLGLFVGGAFLGLSGIVGSRVPRAFALGALWLLLTIAGTAYFQYEQDSVGPAGIVLRGDPWWSSLGGRLLLSAWGVAALAMVVSFSTLAGLRWIGPALVVLGAALAGGILNDYAGYLHAVPTLEPEITEPLPETGAYAVTIPVKNLGNRPFWLGGDRVRVPRASAYVLERKTDEDTWVSAGAPTVAVVGETTYALDMATGLAVEPGSSAGIRHELVAGTYRVRISPQWSDIAPPEHTFTLKPFTVDLETFFPADEAAEGGTTAPLGSGVTVELRGVLDAEASQPKFSVIITMADGTERREQFVLGEKLHGEWVISEFSPAHNTMTLSDGKRLLIVERGKPEEIP